jgi:hypothetical protein
MRITRRQLLVAYACALAYAFATGGKAVFNWARNQLQSYRVADQAIQLKFNAKASIAVAMSTKCRYCAESLYSIGQLADKILSNELVGVQKLHLLFEEPESQARALLGTDFLPPATEVNSSVSFKQIGVTVVPSLYLFGPGGNVVYKRLGVIREQQVKAIVEEIRFALQTQVSNG